MPVAAVLLEDRDGELAGAPFYVMEKVAGHVVRSSLPDGHAESEAEKVALADALVDVLVALHLLDPASLGLEDFARRDGFLGHYRLDNCLMDLVDPGRVAAVLDGAVDPR